MANIDNAYTIDMLSLDDNVLIVSGTIDPSITTGYEAPIGSVYIRTDGSMYQKTNTADVDWTSFGQAGAGVSQLNDLTDVTLVTPVDGESLIYNSATLQWENVLTAVTTPGTGRVLQVKFDRVPAVSGTAQITIGPTDPLITEGVPLWSEVITPADVTSNIRVTTSATCSGSSNSTQMIFTFFRNSVCIGAGLVNMSARTAGHPFSTVIYDTPNTLAQTTYSCRVAKTSGNTWYVNRLADATDLNGQLANQAYTVEEIGVN